MRSGMGPWGLLTNPVIVATVLKKSFSSWEPEIKEYISAHPRCSEEELAWAIIEKMAVRAAKLLEPIFNTSRGRKGRLSIQINPQYYRNKDMMVEQALHLNFHRAQPEHKASRHLREHGGPGGTRLPGGQHECDRMLHRLPGRRRSRGG